MVVQMDIYDLMKQVNDASIKDTVSAVKEKIVSGTALLF